MVSVERVIEYTQLPPEDALFKENNIDKIWPHHGAITTQNANFRYSEKSPTALRDFSINIKPREKV